MQVIYECIGAKSKLYLLNNIHNKINIYFEMEKMTRLNN